MSLKSIVVSKLVFWVSQYFATVARFIITSLSKHRLKPSQRPALTVEMGLQRELTLCLMGRLDNFCDV